MAYDTDRIDAESGRLARGTNDVAPAQSFLARVQRPRRKLRQYAVLGFGILAVIVGISVFGSHFAPNQYGFAIGCGGAQAMDIRAP